MSETAIACLIFGLMALGMLALFVKERIGVARRRAARGGREIDVSNLIFFGSAAGEGEKTHE